MKRFLFSFLFILSWVFQTRADELYLGYADGNEVETSLSDQGFDSSNETSCAILLPTSSFWMYEGCGITSLRIGITANATNVTVFLTTDLAAAPLVSKTLKSLYTGWNDIELSDVVTIGTQDLYVGFTAARSGIIGCSGEYEAGVNWVKTQGGEWQQLVGANASICIEATVDDQHYAHHDAHLITLAGGTAAKGEPYQLTGRFRNNTPDLATTLTLQYQHPDGTMRTAEAQTSEVLPGEIGTFGVMLDAIGEVGQYDLTATLIAINGEADDYLDNSSLTTHVTVYGKLVQHRPLVEFFTTAKCVNCPTGHAIWERVLAHHPQAVSAAHHVGYYTDDYTVADSEQMLAFYNAGGSTYAPAAMVDRRNCSDLGAGNGNGVASPGPAFHPSSDELCDRIVSAAEAEYSPLDIELSYTYDAASRELGITAVVTPLAGFEQPAYPQLNLFLTEDGLQGYQSGSATVYTHNDVIRQFVTATWGDPISLSAEPSVQSYTLVLPSDWDASRMHIIAFVTDHHEDINDRLVVHATQCNLTGETAIRQIETDATTATACYDLSGRLQPSAVQHRGLVIDASHRVIFVR